MARLDRLRGSITALVTPFRNGEVDEGAFRALVAWQIDQGTQGFVPVGTTGESPTLRNAEHKKVVEICIEEARGRVPVIAGAGSNNTAEAVEFARHAEKAGADGVLVVTPYYNKPNQEGLFRHFQAVDAAIGIPILIYNIPPRSVVDMSVETMKRCFELKNVVGVKDATGNVGRISMQRQALGPDFLQFSGDDLTALACMAAGAHGCISVVSNLVPRLCADLHKECLQNRFDAALAVQDRLTPLCLAVFLEAGVTGAKYGLSLLGKCAEDVRLPLVPIIEPARQAVRDALAYASVSR
jgi:4-hydroxy-tetrahydrodipicolinate synthase